MCKYNEVKEYVAEHRMSVDVATAKKGHLRQSDMLVTQKDTKMSLADNNLTLTQP